MSPTPLIAWMYSFFLGSERLWSEVDSPGCPFERVKSMATFRLIWQPPKTYSRKLVLGLRSNFLILRVSLPAYNSVVPPLSSDKVVKALPKTLWLPVASNLSTSILISYSSSLLHKVLVSMMNSFQSLIPFCWILHSDLKTGLYLPGDSHFQTMRKRLDEFWHFPSMLKMADWFPELEFFSSPVILILPLLLLAAFLMSTVNVWSRDVTTEWSWNS